MKKVTPKKIADIVNSVFKVDVRGSSQEGMVSDARIVYSYLAEKYCDDFHIDNILGEVNRDRTNIYYYRRQFDAVLNYDEVKILYLTCEEAISNISSKGCYVDHLSSVFNHMDYYRSKLDLLTDLISRIEVPLTNKDNFHEELYKLKDRDLINSINRGVLGDDKV